jgi:hypothetical protein
VQQQQRQQCPLALPPSSFTLPGSAGVNLFRFSGRLAGRKLALGRYQLVATPSAAGKTGRAASAPFRIIR